MALKLSEADLRPMESFPLKWRWTDARWNLLPADDLARIVPLTEAKAKRLCQYGGGWFDGSHLDPKQFLVSKWDDSNTTNPNGTRAWLSERISDKSETVWVSLGNADAVVTNADIFCRYWDDFCYPAGADVVIWSFSETWVLYYFHEEMLYFGLSIHAK